MDSQTNYDFYEQNSINKFPWRSVLMFVGMIGIIILVVYFFVATMKRMKKRRSKCRPKKHRKGKYYDMATDDIRAVYMAHTKDMSDPLVAAYNRPDIVASNAALKRDIALRMRATILADTFDDIEMLEKIIQINEDLDIDDTLNQLAPMVAARVGHINKANFDVRADDVLRLMDDPQNVHDPTTIKELNSVLKDFTGEYTGEYTGGFNKNIAPEIDIVINNMTTKGEISETRASDARRVLSKMITSHGTCMSYGNRRESEIFQTTWSAADTYDKKYNIILGLADSATSGGGTVCMNGRIARILGANTTQASGAELKSAVYSYAGKVMTSGGNFAEVEKYINGIEQFTDSQKNILMNECKSVFDDLNDYAGSDAPIGNDTNNDDIIINNTVDNGVSGINIAEPALIAEPIPEPTPITELTPVVPAVSTTSSAEQPINVSI